MKTSLLVHLCLLPEAPNEHNKKMLVFNNVRSAEEFNHFFFMKKGTFKVFTFPYIFLPTLFESVILKIGYPLELPMGSVSVCHIRINQVRILGMVLNYL